MNKILVGNKCDLESERQVTFEEGTQMAAEFGIPFLEASAKDNINVSDAFMQITRNVIPTLSHTPKPSGIKLDQKSGAKQGGKKCC